MKEYAIQVKEEELVLQFHFQKTSSVFYALFFTTIFIVFFVFSYPGSVYNSWGALLLMFCLGLYLTFESYFEWKKYKTQSIKKVNDEIHINATTVYKNYNIKTINVVNIGSQHFGGWKVYLSTHYGTEDYTIKTRLKKEEATAIAQQLAAFLEKEVHQEN